MAVMLIILIHVLGATIWTGGHLVLALGVPPDALRRRDPSPVAAFEAQFERLGIPALLVQVVTGLWLAYRYLPDPAQWVAFDSPLASHIGAKLILLALTLTLAVLFVVMGVGIRAGGWV